MKFFRNLSTLRRDRAMARDVKAMELELGKQALLSYPPRQVTVGILSSCTNRCTFCSYHSEDAKGVSNVYGLKYKLSFEKYKKMVDMLHAGRVPAVHLCATGEPFLHNEILDFMDYTADVYGSVSVQTNFYKSLFDKKNLLEEIARRSDRIKYITTDIMAGDAETHNEIKKGSNFEDVLSAMEYLSREAGIHFEAHTILTRYNYKTLPDLVRHLAERKINCHLAIADLHPHGFNEMTMDSARYSPETDHEITAVLAATQAAGKQYGIQVSVPQPKEDHLRQCQAFWTRFQVWPAKGNNEERYDENIIVGGCNAVVLGDLNSLGYFFDYDNIMDLWNNPKLVQIRQELIRGMYPSSYCTTCQNYSSTRACGARKVS